MTEIQIEVSSDTHIARLEHSSVDENTTPGEFVARELPGMMRSVLAIYGKDVVPAPQQQWFGYSFESLADDVHRAVNRLAYYAGFFQGVPLSRNVDAVLSNFDTEMKLISDAVTPYTEGDEDAMVLSGKVRAVLERLDDAPTRKGLELLRLLSTLYGTASPDELREKITKDHSDAVNLGEILHNVRELINAREVDDEGTPGAVAAKLADIVRTVQKATGLGPFYIASVEDIESAIQNALRRAAPAPPAEDTKEEVGIADLARELGTFPSVSPYAMRRAVHELKAEQAKTLENAGTVAAALGLPPDATFLEMAGRANVLREATAKDGDRVVPSLGTEDGSRVFMLGEIYHVVESSVRPEGAPDAADVEVSFARVDRSLG